jgi:hypothetical protein
MRRVGGVHGWCARLGGAVWCKVHVWCGAAVMSRGLLTLEVYESMRVDRLGKVHMLVGGVVVRAAEWCVSFGFLHSFAVPISTGPSLGLEGQHLHIH